MGENHTHGKRLQWAKIPKEKRQEIMRQRALKGWSKKTKAQKKERSLIMEKARLAKLT